MDVVSCTTTNNKIQVTVSNLVYDMSYNYV